MQQQAGRLFMEQTGVWKLGGLEIRYNRILLIQGLVLYLIGLLGPRVLPAGSFHIYMDLTSAMPKEHCVGLLTAALKLVLMNVARMIPHYLGAFLMNESVHFYRGGKRTFIYNIILTFGLILLMYQMIYFLDRVRYDGLLCPASVLYEPL